MIFFSIIISHDSNRLKSINQKKFTYLDILELIYAGEITYMIGILI